MSHSLRKVLVLWAFVSILPVPQLLAQTLRDGPYVKWLSNGDALIEGVCEGRAVRSTFKDETDLLLAHPCTGEALTLVPRAMETPSHSYANVEKFFVLSDVEGQYDSLLKLLRRHAIIDAENNWSYGKGHLVFLGDMVDRGEFVTEVLWLIHKLENQAEVSGGRVHYVLGNHEKMLLEGDNRYLHEKYVDVSEKLARPFKDLFAIDTEFGRWFRSRNSIVKINDTLFVHAGLSPELWRGGQSLLEFNENVRAGLTDPDLSKTNSRVKWVLSSDGPLWYRGYFKDETLKPSDIQATLAPFGARRVVVGHTIVPEIQILHSGLVIAVDTSFKKADKIQALLFDKGRYFRASLSGIQAID